MSLDSELLREHLVCLSMSTYFSRCSRSHFLQYGIFYGIKTMVIYLRPVPGSDTWILHLPAWAFHEMCPSVPSSKRRLAPAGFWFKKGCFISDIVRISAESVEFIEKEISNSSLTSLSQKSKIPDMAWYGSWLGSGDKGRLDCAEKAVYEIWQSRKSPDQAEAGPSGCQVKWNFTTPKGNREI